MQYTGCCSTDCKPPFSTRLNPQLLASHLRMGRQVALKQQTHGVTLHSKKRLQEGAGRKGVYETHVCTRGGHAMPLRIGAVGEARLNSAPAPQ